MIVLLLSRIVRFKKRIRAERTKVSTQNCKSKLFRCNAKFTSYSKWFQSIRFFSRFQRQTSIISRFSIIHSNNYKSKTLNRLKKFAQFVEVSMRNEFSLFSIFKSWKNHSKTTTSIVLFSIRSIKNQNNKNIFKS